MSAIEFSHRFTQGYVAILFFEGVIAIVLDIRAVVLAYLLGHDLFEVLIVDDVAGSDEEHGLLHRSGGDDFGPWSLPVLEPIAIQHFLTCCSLVGVDLEAHLEELLNLWAQIRMASEFLIQIELLQLFLHVLNSLSLDRVLSAEHDK